MRNILKGGVGVSMAAGNSRKIAAKRNVSFIIKALDILRLHEHGEKGMSASVMCDCEMATKAPPLLSKYQCNNILHAWIEYAEQGKLRGIRGPGYLSKTNYAIIVDTPTETVGAIQ